MKKLKIMTSILLTAFIAVFTAGCSKDEPSVRVEITPEGGEMNTQFPYSYAKASINFACSADYLEFCLPSFAIVSSSHLELIQPSRNEFKLADEKSTVFLVENGDTVKRDVPVYEYSFNVNMEATDSGFVAFALSSLNEGLEENFRENIDIYRGYEDINIQTYCPDGEMTMSNNSNLSNVFGYKGEDNKVTTLLNVYLLYNQIPVIAVMASDSGNKTPDFHCNASDWPLSKVEDYFNSFIPASTPKIENSIRTEIINQVEEVIKNNDGFFLDVNTLTEGIERTSPQ